MKKWIKELKRILGNDVVLAIVGNKIDLEKDRTVTVATAEQYANSVNARLFHTSAKSSKGVDELFSDLAARTSIFFLFIFYRHRMKSIFFSL